MLGLVVAGLVGIRDDVALISHHLVVSQFDDSEPQLFSAVLFSWEFDYDLQVAS